MFDNPGRQPSSPKAIEQRRRDNLAFVPSDHKHLHFTDISSVPRKWRVYLGCRVCKRRLILYLGQAFVQHASAILRGEQNITLAGCFDGDSQDQAWEVNTTSTQQVPALLCEAEEADTRVWLHALRSSGCKKLVCSPDTDVYHIGLPLVSQFQCDVIVQISSLSSIEHKYLSITQLCSALSNDPDLAVIPEELRPQMMQSLFICTGCDYISFFKGIGKVTVMDVVFQHSGFISSNTPDCPGNISGMGEADRKERFLAFVRLVGTLYFKKYCGCSKHSTPTLAQPRQKNCVIMGGH